MSDNHLNPLEMAMLDPSGVQMDLYLESTDTQVIMAHINEIKEKAMVSTSAGELKQKIQAVLDEAE